MAERAVRGGLVGEKLIDDLARALAQPMPRRRAVRLLGITLVSVALPGVSARTVTAGPRQLPDPHAPPQKCIDASYRGPTGGQACCGRTYADGTKTEWKSCGYPWQQYRCAGSENFTCVDRCKGDQQKELSKTSPGKKALPTWSSEKAPDGGPKRYECCTYPDYLPRDGECLPNCPYGYRFGFQRGPVACGKTCCLTYERCVSGQCKPCERPWQSCQPARSGETVCCEPGTKCCANNRTTACCGPKQKCNATGKQAKCICEKGKKCGRDCCEKTRGETCCQGQECCKRGETCASNGCCPEGRAMCRPRGGGKPTCCRENEYCLWKVETVGEDELAPLIGVCKKQCAPGNRCGTQCCGAGFQCTAGRCVRP